MSAHLSPSALKSTLGVPSLQFTPCVVLSTLSPNGGFFKTSTNTVTPTTELNHLRLRGRSFGLRVESTTQGVNWRLGTPRVDLRADGDR